MTDKLQKIKDWISKEQDGLMDANGNFDYPEHEGAYHILCNLDAYIDSLPEEPVSKDLEEEIEMYVNTPANQGNPDLRKELSECAHHFAKWQKQQMMKEVYTGIYDCNDDTSWIGFKGWLLSTSKVGNKVKLIIINEE